MKAAKEQRRKRSVYRIKFEPDYSDKVWLKEGDKPTPATHPDAFYREASLLYPIAQTKRARLKPHEWLSKTQLKKRLCRAGVQAQEASRIAGEILGGPSEMKDQLGVTALGWNVDVFRTRYGRRITRFVMRFVKRSVAMIDEAWRLLSTPGVGELTAGIMKYGRKYNTSVVPVTQSHGDLSSARNSS